MISPNITREEEKIGVNPLVFGKRDPYNYLSPIAWFKGCK